MQNRIVDEWLEGAPGFGRRLGLHEYDGKAGDYSASGIRARIAWLERSHQSLLSFNRAELTPDESLDHAILTQAIERSLFYLVDLERWRRFPQFYRGLFAVNAYLDRDYAPLETRVRALLTHEKAALQQVAHIRANLTSPLSKPVVETAIKIYAGYAKYLRGEVVEKTKGVGDAKFQADLYKTNEALAAAAQALADHLKQVELPKSDDSHVLGAKRYQKLLRVQEGLTSSLEAFEKMGQENLEANRKAYEALREGVKSTRPSAQNLLSEASSLVEVSHAFVQDRNLVSLPGHDAVAVKETPPYKRWNAASLSAPGPFEQSSVQTFYYITLPDPSWPKKEQEEYVMTRGTLVSTTVHEVFPGHFVQSLWRKQAPTRVQRTFGSYSFTEGWAHYTEQMMVEEGFRTDDPETKVGQLSDALLRNCRYLVSIGIHTKGMSLDAAERLFMDRCYQNKALAREQAIRATFDPGYFAYTLGKLQILELRSEARKQLGKRFSLQKFHDALLSHGAPPVALIRSRVLEELEQYGEEDED